MKMSTTMSHYNRVDCLEANGCVRIKIAPFKNSTCVNCMFIAKTLFCNWKSVWRETIKDISSEAVKILEEQIFGLAGKMLVVCIPY